MNAVEKLKQIRNEGALLYKAAPNVSQAFLNLGKVANVEGALSCKTKELIAIAVSVQAHCDGCIVYHVNEVIRHGGSREEVAEAISISIEMGGGPSAVYGGSALAAFDQLKNAST